MMSSASEHPPSADDDFDAFMSSSNTPTTNINPTQVEMSTSINNAPSTNFNTSIQSNTTPMMMSQEPTNDNFSPLNVGSGTMSSPSTTPTPPPPPENRSFLAQCLSCCTVDHYRTYFDVNTADVQHRIVSSMRYFNVMGGFHEYVLAGKRPDAYGPFWIATTLVFFVAVTSNIHAYLHSDDLSTFEYDISHLFRAMIVLYAFSFFLPLLYSVVFRCLSIQMPFIDLFSLYGYSLVPYAPATIFAIIPDTILVWFVLIIATIVSLIFVLRNVVGPIMQSESRAGRKIAGPVLGSVIGCHVVFFLVLKLGFYHHVKKRNV